MPVLPKPISKEELPPDVSALQATIASLAKEVISLKDEVKDQKKENSNFIFGIIGGFFAVVVVVAVEIILFHSRSEKDILELNNQYFQKIEDIRQENNSQTNDIKNFKLCLDNSRWLNPKCFEN